MSTTVPRLIIVDDVDESQIHYTGPWFSDLGSQDYLGTFGTPFRSTLHGTKANASLSFAFNGTKVIVFGTNNIRNDSGVIDPTWQCFVDNNIIDIAPPNSLAQNHAIFCEKDTLSDGLHVLTVNATVTKEQTFWFDDIQYIPSASVPLDQADIIVDNLDPALQYGQGWADIGGFANITAVNGSIFTYNFIGVSLSWFGFVPNELPLSPSSATYSIDGQTPTPFSLKGIPPNTWTNYNQKFFEIPQLPVGPHTLKVVYQGNDKTTPLTLDYLIIQNGTLRAPTTTSISSYATSGSSDGFTGTSSHATSGYSNGITGTSSHATSSDGVSGTSIPGKNSTPVGAITGGVIGGLALIVFVILGILLLCRRQKRVVEEKILSSTPRPFDYTPLHPSSTTPNHSLSGGISYSEAPPTTQIQSGVTYRTKGYTYHASMPSRTKASQPIESPSTSSDNTTYPINLRPIPLQLQRTAANPPLPPPPVSVPDSSLPRVVLHADSGIRMPSSTARMSVTDVPPLYTLD